MSMPVFRFFYMILLATWSRGGTVAIIIIKWWRIGAGLITRVYSVCTY